MIDYAWLTQNNIALVRRYEPNAILQSVYNSMYCVEDGNGRRLSGVVTNPYKAWLEALTLVSNGGSKPNGS